MSTSSEVDDSKEDPAPRVVVGQLRCEHHRKFFSCDNCRQTKYDNIAVVICYHQLPALACEICSNELTIVDPKNRKSIPYVIFLRENRLRDFMSFLKRNNKEWFDKLSGEIDVSDSTDCESMEEDNDEDSIEDLSNPKESIVSSGSSILSDSSESDVCSLSSFPKQIWVKKTAKCCHNETPNKCSKCLEKLNANYILDTITCSHNESAIFCSTCYNLYEIKGSKLTIFEYYCKKEKLSFQEINFRFPKISQDLQSKDRLPFEEEDSNSLSSLAFPKLPVTKPRKKKVTKPNNKPPTNSNITDFKKKLDTPVQGPSNDAKIVKTNIKTEKGFKARIKLKNLLCQHNISLSSCNNCNATNLKDLDLRSKCLHRIPPTNCNHCKDKIYILKKGKERTRLRDIKEEDYIPYRIYEKIYLSNVTNKNFTNKNKNQDNNNEQNPSKQEILNKRTLENTKEPEPKLRKIQPEPQINNNKRDFTKLDDPDMEPMDIETKQPKINIEERSPPKMKPLDIETKQPKINSEDTTVNIDPIKKPPPIFIVKENPEEIRKIIDGYEIKNFTLKVVSNKQIKVNLKSDQDFRFFLFKLGQLEVEHYTFKSFNGKVARRIIRGLPVDFDINILKSELEKFEILKIKNIVQLRNRFTKNPIPLFKIEFKSYEKIWEKLENIKIINNYEITFERLGIKQIEIPICGICLQYGHTKNFCKSKLVCIICNDNHHSKVCPIPDSATLKNEIWRPTCLHCKEAHFTHWKGCKVYKKLRNQRIKKYKELNEECKKLAVEEKRLADIDKRDGILTPNNKNNKPNDEIKKLKIEIKNLEAKRLEEISHLKKDILSLKKEIAELKLTLTSH